jgi:hypothetical protein
MIDDITLRNLSPAGIAATSRDVTISAVKGIKTTPGSHSCSLNSIASS